jgi:hypothetical protein
MMEEIVSKSALVQGRLTGLLPSFGPILTSQANRIQIRIARAAFQYLIRRLLQVPSLDPVKVGNDDAGGAIDAHVAVDVDDTVLA